MNRLEHHGSVEIEEARLQRVEGGVKILIKSVGRGWVDVGTMQQHVLIQNFGLESLAQRRNEKVQ